MNQKRFVGFTLILLGMLVSFSRIAMTGAVIGVEKSTLVGIFGAAIVFLGFMVLISSKYRPDRAKIYERIREDFGKERYESLQKAELNSLRRHYEKAYIINQLEKKVGGYSTKESRPEPIYLPNLATQYLKERHIPEKAEELKYIVRQCGYIIRSGVKEGFEVLDKEGNKIASIPKSKTITRGVSRNVLIAAATGKYHR